MTEFRGFIRTPIRMAHLGWLMLLFLVPSIRAANPVLVDQWPGWRSNFAYGVTVNGNYAYVADSNAGLHIFDISNPTLMIVGGCKTSGLANGVAVSGSHAFVADFEWGMAHLPNRAVLGRRSHRVR